MNGSSSAPWLAGSSTNTTAASRSASSTLPSGPRSSSRSSFSSFTFVTPSMCWHKSLNGGTMWSESFLFIYSIKQTKTIFSYLGAWLHTSMESHLLHWNSTQFHRVWNQCCKLIKLYYIKQTVYFTSLTFPDLCLRHSPFVFVLPDPAVPSVQRKISA